MSILTDLRAALDAKREADRGTQAWHDARFRLMDMLLNTEDTIAALVAVARAGDAMPMLAWCEEGFYIDMNAPLSEPGEHGEARYAEITEEEVVERSQALFAALAPLVKEADHDRA